MGACSSKDGVKEADKKPAADAPKVEGEAAAADPVRAAEEPAAEVKEAPAQEQ